MTAITNLSEDDRGLISWHVREFMDTYEMYHPNSVRRHVMSACFRDLRLWTKWFSIRSALSELDRQRERIPEVFEAAQSAEAAYWHRAPRSWE